MSKNLKLFIECFAILIFISCNKPKQTEYEIQHDKFEKLEALNLNESLKISKAANALLDWDTIKGFSYDLQDLLLNKPISFTGELKDVLKTDSNFKLILYNKNPNSIKNYIAEVLIDSGLFQSLNLNLDRKHENKGCFIFEVANVNSHFPILSSEIDPDGESVKDATSYLVFDYYESVTKIQGKLISYYIFETQKSDD